MMPTDVAINIIFGVIGMLSWDNRGEFSRQ